MFVSIGSTYFQISLSQGGGNPAEQDFSDSHTQSCSGNHTQNDPFKARTLLHQRINASLLMRNMFPNIANLNLFRNNVHQLLSKRQFY